MRHKQRPIKSRHKSVTFIIDSHTTSFGVNNNQTSLQQQQQHLFLLNNEPNYMQDVGLHGSDNDHSYNMDDSVVETDSQHYDDIEEDDDDDDNVEDVDDNYGMLDSEIFATAPSNQTFTYRSHPILAEAPISMLQLQKFQRRFQQPGSSNDVPTSRAHVVATPKSIQQLQKLQRQNQQPGGSASQRSAQAVNRATASGGVRKSSPKDLMVSNNGEGFYCKEAGCGKSFPSLRKLRHHNVVHSDDFPFICEFRGCNKKFKRKFGIDLHSTTHFDLDPEMYSKTSNNSSLPFFGRRMQYSMCKPCNQKFKTVHDYQNHMKKHNKEPFKCPVKGCGQTFSIWKSFQKHRASHYFNYYCRMDPRCDHHTSNLQLLKLHIYCCHFRRKLPGNATLSSRMPIDDEIVK